LVKCKIIFLDFFWTDWSEFGPCLSSCGSGEQTRTRNCQDAFTGENVAPENCIGPRTESRICHNPACFEGKWKKLPFVSSFKSILEIFVLNLGDLL